MSNPQTRSESAKPEVKFNQEIRFAVVMYGGASLAIYINGVAQELLRLVRATAPEPGGDMCMGAAHLDDGQLKGSERVYRQIGRILSRGESPAVGAGATDISKGLGLPIRTRFVVDILTGTSAGGINAIYLAKALANDQNMNELKKLWVKEGDIGVLINDRSSYEELEIKLEDPEGEPWSLLNSRRMYVRLLEALRGMDYPKRLGGVTGEAPQVDNETGGTALVDDLDLYVTSTDIDGRIIQMRLADKVVSERRHRNVFHFRYRSERPEGADPKVNDFKPKNSAFLAFAARATSAHQAAFSPVKLDDVAHVLEKYKLQDVYKPEDENLWVFFRDYLLQRADEEGKPINMDQKQLADAFRSIWFNDGGSLDNKPFTFVFEELPQRQASAVVDRKLLYVEPSPEHLKWARASEKRPQIVQNAWGGLSTLPSYETIVGDLTRLLERNRLIERVRHITEDTEDDIKSRYGGSWPETLPMDELRQLRLDKLISKKGTAWGGYQRLRIAQVTDDLTLLIARAASIDEDSDEYTAIRQLVRYWRLSRYDDHDDQKKAEIGFLLDYDLQWTVRRVRFVMRKLDEISCFDKRARKLAEQTNQPKIKITWPANEEQEEEFSRSLCEIRKSLGAVLARLNAARRAFWAYRNDVVKGALPEAKLKLTQKQAKQVFDELPDAERSEQSNADLYANVLQAIDLMPAGGDSDPILLSIALGAAKLSEGSRWRRFLEAFVYLNPFRDEVYDLGIPMSYLREFLKLPTEDKRKEELGRYLGEPSHRAAFDALVEKVRAEFKSVIDDSRNACRAVLREPEKARQPEPEKARQLDPAESVPYILLYYFKTFEAFDQVTFPILYSTDVGEEMDTIEVFRVSPEDAPTIIDEEKEKKLKLAGTTLGHFGAFFERKFRINDIMWGRLDGAERLIAALLPTQDDLRKEFTRQAHLAIIEEEAVSKVDLAWEQAKDALGGLPEAERGKQNVLSLYKKVEEAIRIMQCQLHVGSLVASSQIKEEEAISAKLACGDCESALSTIESEAKSLSAGSTWRNFFEAFVSEFRPFSSKFIVPRADGTDTLDAFRSWFHAQYEDGRQLTPEESRKSAVRINQVLGGMVQGYFPEEGKRDWKHERLLWLGKRIQIFIEAALQPGGVAHRKLRRRLIAAYIISLLLLVGIFFLNGMWMWVALAVVFLIALIPLALTVIYHVAWHKFKSLLASFPPKL